MINKFGQNKDVNPRTKNLQSSTENQPTYAEKTERIRSWVQFFQSVTPIIWAIVILLVIVPLFGQIFIGKAFSPLNDSSQTKPPVVVVERDLVDWSQVDVAMTQAIKTAHESSEAYALQELDRWINELMSRVDNNFLDWYFSYINQKQIEYKSLFIQLSAGAIHLLNPDRPTPAEKVAEVVTEDFQTEFAKRVLHPQLAQLKLERITEQTVKLYFEELKGNLAKISVTYQIPKADWNRYLNDIAISINDTEGNLSNFSFKVLAGGGAYLGVKPLVAPLVAKVGSKIVAKLTSKTGAKIATKTGASLAGKIGAGFLDATIGVGIVIWDIWDTYHSAQIEKPILRENTANYLQEVKYSLLDRADNSIMAAIGEVESKMIAGLESR